MVVLVFQVMTQCPNLWVADVTEVLCELQLTIKKVKVSTTPHGKVIDLFFITETRFIFYICFRAIVS